MKLASTSLLQEIFSLRYVLFSFLLPLPLAGCGAAVSAAVVDPTEQIATMLVTEQNAWNAKDNVAYASVFSADADFMNIRGQIVNGQAAITQLHGQIFAGPFKGSSVNITVRLFKVLAPGVVVVDTDQVVTNYAFLPPGIVPTSAGTLLTHLKYVAVMQSDGSWKFVLAQNTSVLPNGA